MAILTRVTRYNLLSTLMIYCLILLDQRGRCQQDMLHNRQLQTLLESDRDDVPRTAEIGENRPGDKKKWEDKTRGSNKIYNHQTNFGKQDLCVIGWLYRLRVFFQLFAPVDMHRQDAKTPSQRRQSGRLTNRISSVTNILFLSLFYSTLMVFFLRSSPD